MKNVPLYSLNNRRYYLFGSQHIASIWLETIYIPLNALLLQKQVYLNILFSGTLILKFVHLVSRNTLGKLQNKLTTSNAKQIVRTVSTLQKTNNNSKKPSVLRQLFRAYVENNRTSNGRHKGIK